MLTGYLEGMSLEKRTRCLQCAVGPNCWNTCCVDACLDDGLICHGPISDKSCGTWKQVVARRLALAPCYRGDQ